MTASRRDKTLCRQCDHYVPQVGICGLTPLVEDNGKPAAETLDEWYRDWQQKCPFVLEYTMIKEEQDEGERME